MWKLIPRLFRRHPVFRPGPVELPRLILTEPSVLALQSCMDLEIKEGKEGIAYLLGQSDGTTTLVVSVIRPRAQTTQDSFSVSSPAMAQAVRTTVSFGLQVVGQAHTHPGEAYHSEGDEKGARIAYVGWVPPPCVGCRRAHAAVRIGNVLTAKSSRRIPWAAAGEFDFRIAVDLCQLNLIGSLSCRDESHERAELAEGAR